MAKTARWRSMLERSSDEPLGNRTAAKRHVPEIVSHVRRVAADKVGEESLASIWPIGEPAGIKTWASDDSLVAIATTTAQLGLPYVPETVSHVHRVAADQVGEGESGQHLAHRGSAGIKTWASTSARRPSRRPRSYWGRPRRCLPSQSGKARGAGKKPRVNTNSNAHVWSCCVLTDFGKAENLPFRYETADRALAQPERRTRLGRTPQGSY
jgi:hypothetical protein